ncbi:hypothetical protein [Acinetobacter baumannii]|uniref:hypothetical protein n=1 Tax=Acinetobacter baumannii TaxID=470 RepID=UPI0022EB9D13|nr:hypothetical protein [Acinetobacter baumannii]MDA3431663.1 hypothetical protein [Acinetobacter baumannii]
MSLNLGRHIQTRTGDLYDVKAKLNILNSATYKGLVQIWGNPDKQDAYLGPQAMEILTEFGVIFQFMFLPQYFGYALKAVTFVTLIQIFIYLYDI